MGLRWRITLPLTALLLGVLGAMILVSIRLVERAVERRFQAQADGLAKLVSQRGFPLNPQTLAYIREAYGADVAVVRQGESAPGGDGLEVSAPVEGGRLVLRFPREIVERERADAVRPVLILGAGAMIMAILLGFVLARTVARPLEKLADRAAQPPVERVGGGPEVDRLVAALNRMAEEIRRAEQFAVMGRMAAAVAHEIKNPLAAMKMNVQMLREEAGDREPYDMLLREIERLELAASELAGRPEKLVKERVSLGRVVDEVLELLRLQLGHLKVSVVREFEKTAEVEVDPARFKRAVMNLVLNGAQAMPGGGELRLEIRPSGNGSIRFRVSDSGPGVPAELRDRLFEPFVTTKQDGVGLGLVLTKRIVEEHGGSISFDSSDRGTTFTVELPTHG